MEEAVVEEWVVQCQNGQTRAYAQVVKALQQPVLGFLYRMTQNREWAEDLGQETFLRAYRLLDQYDPKKAKFSTWLFTMARNLCLDEMRKRRLLSVPLDDAANQVPCAHATAFKRLQEVELEQCIASAIQALEPEFREVFILKEYQELSLDEIAQVAGIPLGTVKSRLYRARLILQEKLAPILQND